MQHQYQSNRKSKVTGVQEKDESFKWGTFNQDLSYHSNEMTPIAPFYIRSNNLPQKHMLLLAIRDNFGNTTWASQTCHSCLNDGNFKKKNTIRAFSRKLRVKFHAVKLQQKQNYVKCYCKLRPQNLTKWFLVS